MSTAIEPAAEETEAYRTLLARVGRRSPKIPADVLVRHVLRCVPPGEWPARVEALDALLRRLESARRDRLRIDMRPEGGRLLGAYGTRRPDSGARPYCSVLAGVEPIESRCDCPDFVKNSLGVCKHILIVLEHLHVRPRLFRKALEEQEEARATGDAGLRWDPIRPLTGAGDWLERVAWSRPPEAKGPQAGRAAQAVARWFRCAEDGTLVLKRSFLDDPARRLALVEDLLKALPDGAPGPATTRRCARPADGRAPASEAEGEAGPDPLRAQGVVQRREADIESLPARGRGALPRRGPPAPGR